MPRSVWLLREGDRAESINNSTISLSAVPMRRPAASGDGAPGQPWLPFRDLFRRHYAVVREIVEAHPEPGLALVVVGTGGIEARAWVGAEPDAANPIILGRHNAAEVFLPSDPSLSLRHLALILDRRRDAPLRFRVLDLRTTTAFRDEGGRRLEGVEAAGPILLRCASFALMLFPTGGDEGPWPDDAESAWRRVPECAWLDASTADSERWAQPLVLREVGKPRGVFASDATNSSISFPGPVFVAPRALGSGPPRGELVVSGEHARASLLVGQEAARQGVLLGRYDRCDGAGLPLLAHHSLSRVHLLVIEVGGTLYAIDTASRNGSWLDDQPFRCVRLEPGRPVTLPVNVRVEWLPFH
jgi:hypothetical protein